MSPQPPAGPPTDPFGPRPRPSRRRRLVVGGAVAAAAVIAAGAFAGVSAASSGPSGLRTTVVAVHPVERTLSLVGAVEPVTQAAVAFPASGTVATVDAAVGDTVVAGQTLATLDTTSLLATLHTRQASLDQSRLSLAQAVAGGSTGSTATGSSSGSSASTGSSTGSGGGGSSSAGSVDQAALGAARQAVADAQRSVDTQLAAASAALDTATQACGSTPPSAGGGAPTTTPTTPTTAPSSTSTTTAPAPGGPGGDSGACQAALQTALGAQQSVAAAQQALQDAVGRLESLLAGAGSGGAATTPTTAARSTAGSGGSSASSSTSASRSSAGGSGGAPARTVGTSADDLIAAQKAVDAAEVQVAVAQQAVDAAAVTTPIGGRVVAVNLTPGQQVGGGSTTATIVVAGDGGFEITANVSVTDLPHVHVGETATVTPDGTTGTIAASVVQIGLNPTTSTSGSTTYPVVLAIGEGDSSALRNGGLASVQVTTGETGDVLAVPTSAVTTDNGRRTVTVVDGATTRTVPVSVGTVGATWTEVTDGLQAGQTVVLADLGRALPGSATSSGSGTTAGSAGTARTGTRTGGTSGFAGGAPPGG